MHTKFKIYLFISCLTLVNHLFVNAQTPAKSNKKSILILHGTAHVGNGQVIENSAIGFKEDRITLIGSATQRNIILTDWNEVIDATNKHIYPGFISPNTTIGLTEIDAVRASLDFSEKGDIKPNVRSLIAYNSESKIIPTIRFNGVLIAQSVPREGLISGKSSIFNLDGWNWEDAALKTDDGVWINWPVNYSYNQNDDGKWEYGKNKQHDKQITELNLFFDKAKAYHASIEKQEIDVYLESMKNILTGEQNVYIYAKGAKEINEAIAFIKNQSIKKPVLVGVDDAALCINSIKENNIPVILERVHSLPPQADDDVDYFYTLPNVLNKNGILFCLSYAGDMEVMGSRNLPFTAGTAAAYGLTKEEALSAITYNSAKILGIDKQVGSLEDGKKATLFISNGDALDMKTNAIYKAFINGSLIDLDNHQHQLYKKYSDKYGFKTAD